VPWKPDVAKEVARLTAEERAGRPKGLFATCLPEGMPSWMLISHNAFEVVFSPGRVTLLGESDGNRLRRIYTDGRAHPADPDPSFHGHSVGHWEGETLVVDTVGVLPESYIAISEAVGVPNNGDMHIVERLRLQGSDRLTDDLTIEAPHVLARPWRTTRIFTRQRERKYEIVEGVCVQGFFSETKDERGNSVFVPVPHGEGGNTLPIRK
jgi:hypothetical protein